MKQKYFVVEQIELTPNELVNIQIFYVTRFKWLADWFCKRAIKKQGYSSSKIEIVVVKGA